MKVEFIFAQMATAVAIATLGLSSAVADALGESITTPSEDSLALRLMPAYREEEITAMRLIFRGTVITC